MVFSRYNYPLPNNGSGYSFSEQELVKLLDSVYDQGYKHGVESTIEPETVTATYRDLKVTVPVGDPTHLWNKDIYKSKYEIVDQAIDEIYLLENVIKSTEIPESVYREFRLQECCRCSDCNCLQSDVEICDCPKFEGFYEA